MPRRRRISAARLVVQRDGVKLQPVIDQAVTEPPRHLRLQAEVARRLGYRLVDHRLELYAVPLDDKPRS